MLLVVGILIGIGAVIGPLHMLRSPGEAATSSLVELGNSMIVNLFERFGTDETHSAVNVAAVLVAVAMPGLVAAALVTLGRGGTHLRRLGSVVAVLVAGVVIYNEPTVAGVAAGFGLLAFGFIVSFAAGAIISVASGTLAGILGATHVLNVWERNDSSITTAYDTLVDLYPVVDGLWFHGLLIVLSVAPMLLIATALDRQH